MNRQELKKRLDAEGYRPDAYSLDGSLPSYDGFVLREANGRWRIEYWERGAARNLGDFDSEEKACERLYDFLKRDRTARTS